MSVDKKTILDALQATRANTLVEHLGISFTDAGEGFVEATMPVDNRTKQVLGYVHGGASAALAETVGSVGSWLLIDREKYYSVGTELSVSHLRSATSGLVKARAEIVYLGKTSHVWDIKITDERSKLTCTGRLTTRVLERTNLSK
jgi:1,4-dihydroxy-2-naphthoyl-CoA hydrolase